MKTRTLLALCLLCTAMPLAADTSPYADDASRDVKALSPDEVAGYLAGSGMGFARAAELNSYPGPRHVLDLAEALALDEAQRVSSRVLFDAMRSRTSAHGAELVALERELDRRFAEGTIDAATLERLVVEIGVLQARIRLAHLAAHLEQKALMTPHQVMSYNRLRGYGSDTARREHSHQHQEPAPRPNGT